jgi:hypothetical protein
MLKCSYFECAAKLDFSENGFCKGFCVFNGFQLPYDFGDFQISITAPIDYTEPLFKGIS